MIGISKNRPVLVLLLGALLSLPVGANSLRIYSVSFDEWSRPRSGDVIAGFEAVRSAVDYWGDAAGNMILVRYPGEDSGEIWATELRDWLVSLGIPSDYIQLVSGSQSADEIRLIVGKRDEINQ